MLDLQRRAGDLDTIEQETGGGGIQLFFRAPLGWTPPTCKTSIGVDIRGQGGFAMMPPSMHESGTAYRWKDGHEPWALEIADKGLAGALAATPALARGVNTARGKLVHPAVASAFRMHATPLGQIDLMEG
jgi:hypothetical protein